MGGQAPPEIKVGGPTPMRPPPGSTTYAYDSGCRRRRCKHTLKSFDLAKIRAKSAKSVKPSQNPRKSGQTPWKYGQKWRPTYFDLKKMAPKVGRMTWRPFFFWRSSQNGRHEKVYAYSHKTWPKIIFRSLGKFGQKSFVPPKICLLLHLWHMIFPSGSVTPVSSDVWWKTPW